MANLVREIKALLKQADSGAEKLYKAAGRKLIELRKDKTKIEFERVIRKECGIGSNWAYTLMRLAKGETTLEKIRAGNSAKKRSQRAQKRAGRTAQDEPTADPNAPGDTPEQQWQRSISNMAGDAISLEAFWTKTFGEAWKKFEVPTDTMTLAQQAAEAWAQIAEQLTRRTGAIPLRRMTHGS